MAKNHRTTFERLPPADADSERAILGAIINEPKRLFDVRPLLDEGQVFYTILLQDLYSILLEISDQGLTIRPLTVIQKLVALGRKDIQDSVHIQDICNEGISCDTVTTALHLRELFIKRTAATQSQELIRLVQDNVPLEAILDKSRELNDLITGKVNIGRKRTMSQISASAFDRIVKASEAKNGLSGVPTGSEKLNRMTGGWQPSDVVIPAGRPGSGKTVVLLHHAKSAAISGFPTAFASLEITSEECTTRLISSECHIPYSDLLKGRWQGGNRFGPDDWKKIKLATEYVASLPIHFIEGGNTDINDLSYAIYDYQQKYGTKLAIIDYLQKATDRTIRGKAYDVVSSVSGKVKGVNLKTQQPIIAGSQLSRAVEAEARKNKRPQLDDLRESGKIEEDGGIVVGLYRDDYYKLKKAKAEVGKGQVFIMPDYDNIFEYDLLKNRNGQLGMVELWIDVATNRIHDKDPALVGAQPLTPITHQEPGADRWSRKFPEGVGRSFGESNKSIEDEDDGMPF